MAGEVDAGRLLARLDLDRSDYNRGLDEAQGRAENFGSSFAGSLRNVAEVAGGILVSQVIGGIANEIKNIGVSAISATAQMQSMQVSFEGLIAREISRGEEVISERQVRTSLSETERSKLAALKDQYEGLTISLRKAQYHMAEISKTQKAGDIDYDSANLQVQKLTRNMNELSGTMSQLEAKENGVTTVTEKHRQKTMDLADAMPLAQEKAKELMNAIADIAILSPYEVGDVQGTFRMAMAYGQTTEEATKFTKAVLNVAAGVGATNDRLNRMSYHLASIFNTGKITEQKMREMALAGLDMSGIFEFLSEKYKVVITDNNSFNDAIASGELTMKQFGDAFVEYAEVNFSGASERMSRTLQGLKSTLHDVFVLTMPQVVGPAVERVTELLNGLLNQFLRIRKSGVLEEMGKSVGVWAQNTIAPITSVISKITEYQKLQDELQNAKGDTQATRVSGQMAALNPKGNILYSALGLDDRTIKLLGDIQAAASAFATFVRETVGPVLQWVSGTLVPALSGVLATLLEHWRALGGALLWIGGLLGAAWLLPAITGIIGAILALLNPVTLVIVAVGLLGAAWAENWWGIRDTLTSVWNTVYPYLYNFWTWVQYVGGVLNDVIQNFGAWRDFPWEQFMPAWLANIVRDVAGAIEDAVFWIGGLIQKAQAGTLKWEDVFPPGVINAFTDAWRTLSGVVEGIIATVQGGDFPWEDVLPAWASTMAYAITDGLRWLIDTIKRVPETFNNAKQAVSDFFNGPIAAGGGETTTRLAAIRNAFDQFVTFMAPAWQNATAGVGSFIGSLDGIWNAIQTKLMPALEPIVQVLGVVLIGALNLLLEVFGSVFAQIGPIVQNAIAAISIALNTVTRIVTDLVNIVKAIIAGDWSAAWASFKDLIVAAVTGLGGILALAADSVFRALSGLAMGIVNWLGNIGLDADGRWKAFVDNALRWIQTLPAGIWWWLADEKNKDSLLATIKRIDLGQIGRDLITGLADGLWDRANKYLREKAQGIASMLPGWVKDMLGIKSPSTVFMQIGQQSMAGFTLGLDRGLQDTVKALGNMPDRLTSGLNLSTALPAAAVGGSTANTTNQNVTIHMNMPIDGGADRETVRQASNDGLMSALRAAGLA